MCDKLPWQAGVNRPFYLDSQRIAPSYRNSRIRPVTPYSEQFLRISREEDTTDAVQEFFGGCFDGHDHSEWPIFESKFRHFLIVLERDLDDWENEALLNLGYALEGPAYHILKKYVLQTQVSRYFHKC